MCSRSKALLSPLYTVTNARTSSLQLRFNGRQRHHSVRRAFSARLMRPGPLGRAGGDDGFANRSLLPADSMSPLACCGCDAKEWPELIVRDCAREERMLFRYSSPGNCMRRATNVA